MSATPRPWTRARIESLIYAGDSEALQRFCEQAALTLNTFDEAKAALVNLVELIGGAVDCQRSDEVGDFIVNNYEGVIEKAKAILAKMEGTHGTD